MRTTNWLCQVHVRHVPYSHVNFIYHILPIQLGGEDLPENTVIVCPTGYFNIVDLLGEWLELGGEPPPSVLHKYTRGERQYAEAGFNRYKQENLDF